MTWSVTYRTDQHLVECRFNGPTSAADLRAATSQGIALGKQYDTHRYLVDTTAIQVEAGLTDLLNLPEQQYPEEGLSRLSRIAVILPVTTDASRDVRFYETASVNRGWIVRSFVRCADAEDWLQQGN
jgi:hypothetical protein